MFAEIWINVKLLDFVLVGQFEKLLFHGEDNSSREQTKPHGIAISRPPLMPSDCSCPRPKLYS